MAKEDNLMSPEELNSRRSPEQHAEDSRKGGKASGEARRAKRLLKDALEIALKLAMKNKDGTPAEHPVTGEPLVAFDAGMVKLVERYAKGDPKAIETVAKLLGQWKEEHKVEYEGDVTIKLVETGYTPASSEEEILKREGIDGTVRE